VLYATSTAVPSDTAHPFQVALERRLLVRLYTSAKASKL
jgi:hypothetical protein